MPNCYVCETADAKGYSQGGDSFRIDCKRCGDFIVSGTAMAMLPKAFSGGLYRRALMSHAIRRMNGFEVSPPPLIVSDKLDDRFHETCIMELMVWWRIPRLRLAKRGAGSWQDGGE
jgi:hypothetical protein